MSISQTNKPAAVKLTKRQQQVFDLVKRYINNTGFPPTRADIAKEFGFKSHNAAEEHLRALAKKGAIEMLPNTSRGIKIPDNDIEKGLPMVGHVAAGYPVLAEEHIESHCDIKPEFFSPPADYLLTVRGDSMKDAGILDGDLLAVHKTTEAKNGQIVVARVDDEVTVKRLKMNKSKKQVLLIPENDDFTVIEVDTRSQQFSIEGIAVGVLRH